MKDNNRAARFGLMRHALTRWNLEKRIQGQTDVKLCRQGVEQARKWAAAIKGSGPWDRILVSGLARSRETAEILNMELRLPMESDSRLDEQDWGEWVGKTRREIVFGESGQLKRLTALGWGFRPPGGEDRRSVKERSAAALEELGRRHKGESILVVAHEGVIKCLIYGLLGRRFLPEEPPVIEPYHLHFVTWDDRGLRIGDLNAVKFDGL